MSRPPRKDLTSDPHEVLKRLEHLRVGFPLRAVRAAVADPEGITPLLLDVLRDVRRRHRQVAENRTYMAHLYALYLLAQFREKRAYPLIVELFSLPGEAVFDLTGDFVTGDLRRVLASVCHGDISLLRLLIEDDQANEWVRIASIEAFVILVVHGLLPREEALAYFRGLFRGGLPRERHGVWGGLVYATTDLHPEELMDEIRCAYDELLVEELHIGLDDVLESLERGREETLESMRSDRRYALIDDTVREMQGWGCFSPPKSVHKPGRNAPCPCGSGLKYKHCCGKKG